MITAPLALMLLSMLGCDCPDCPPAVVCPPATVCPGAMADTDWDSHTSAAVTAAGTAIPPGAPQLHDGQFGFAPSFWANPDFGDVWAKASTTAGFTHREVWIADTFASFKTAANTRVMKQVTDPAWPETNIPPTTGVCPPNAAGKCVADANYNYYPLAGVTGAPTTIPNGVTPLEFKVQTTTHTPCNSTTPTSVVTGRLYRELAIVGGQERWMDHWVLIDPDYKQPSLCDLGTQIGLETLADSPAEPRGLKAFLDAMKNGPCATSGKTCRYAPVKLDWKAP